jgi:hypothetical protein
VYVYKKGKDRSVSQPTTILFVVVVIFAHIKKRKRDIKRNLMMQLAVRRTKNDVFVTTTARNNDVRVSIVCSLSLSLILSSNRCEVTSYIHLHTHITFFSFFPFCSSY